MPSKTGSLSFRLIGDGDLNPTREIYSHYVEHTAISFEYESPTLSEWQSRVNNIMQHHPWIVCEYKNEIAGYAYACKHRDRAAYQWSVDSAVYVSEQYHGKGIARKLYETLFEILKLQGYVNVYAGVTIPNDKSVQFHLAMGFEEIGRYKNVGYKFGRWHDTKWFQRVIGDHDKPPGKILTIAEIIDHQNFQNIFNRAAE